MHKPVIWWGMVIFSHGDRCEICQLFSVTAVAYRRGRGWGLWGFKSPYSKFRRPSKIMPNSTRLWKLLKIAEFRTPTLQDVLKKGSKILKLLPVRSCFTLAMTYRLVVIITSLKVPKMKKILLNELKVLLPNYNCLQNPWLGGYRPQIPVLPVLNWVCWNPPPPKKIPGYATFSHIPLRLLPNVRNARSPASTLVYVCNEWSIEQLQELIHRLTQSIKF